MGRFFDNRTGTGISCDSKRLRKWLDSLVQNKHQVSIFIYVHISIGKRKIVRDGMSHLASNPLPYYYELCARKWLQLPTKIVFRQQQQPDLYSIADEKLVQL